MKTLESDRRMSPAERWRAKQDPLVLKMYELLLRISEDPEKQRNRNIRYYAKNRTRERARHDAWFQVNRDRVNANVRRRRASSDKLRNYDQNRYDTNVSYRIGKLVRNRVVQALKRNYKAKETADLIGCSFDNLRIYIESKFDVGMSWENHGRGPNKWHIDHIMPIAIFDLSKPEHQRRCFHFSNLQPLWEPENLHKSRKFHSGQFHLL